MRQWQSNAAFAADQQDHQQEAEKPEMSTSLLAETQAQETLAQEPTSEKRK